MLKEGADTWYWAYARLSLKRLSINPAPAERPAPWDFPAMAISFALLKL